MFSYYFNENVKEFLMNCGFSSEFHPKSLYGKLMKSLEIVMDILEILHCKLIFNEVEKGFLDRLVVLLDWSSYELYGLHWRLFSYSSTWEAFVQIYWQKCA